MIGLVLGSKSAINPFHSCFLEEIFGEFSEIKVEVGFCLSGMGADIVGFVGKFDR